MTEAEDRATLSGSSRAPVIARDRVLSAIVERLVSAYEPERVYLFGSAARGEREHDADYDVLLVMPDSASGEQLRARRAHEVLWGLGVAVDVVIWRRRAFEARSQVRTSLPATVLREGLLLHHGPTAD